MKGHVLQMGGTSTTGPTYVMMAMHKAPWKHKFGFLEYVTYSCGSQTVLGVPVVVREGFQAGTRDPWVLLHKKEYILFSLNVFC